MKLPYVTYTVNGKTHPVGPDTLGLSKISLVTELETDQVFYRTKWNGDLVFTGDDFRLFWQLHRTSCCQPVYLSLYRTGDSCSDSTPYWKGVFSLSDLDFDVDACQAKLTSAPRPDDGYQTVIDNWGKKVNWMDIKTVQSIYSGDRTILYRRARLLIYLMSGMVERTLKDTPAALMTPYYGPDTISTFLEAAVNPVTRRKNHLQYAVVIQASDVVAPGPAPGLVSMPDPTDYAVKAELTLKELIDDLRELLRLCFYIDPATGKLRWEHESFFPFLSYDPPVAGYSLPDSAPEWKGKRSLTTKRENLFEVYQLSIAPNQTLSPLRSATKQYVTPIFLPNPFEPPGLSSINDPAPKDLDHPTIPLDFSEGSITFSNLCVIHLPGESVSSRERFVNRIATYIKAARDRPDSVSKADWLFLVGSVPSTNPASTIPQIPFGILDTYSVNVENGDLSASSLVRDFHRSNQPFHEGASNVDSYFLPDGIRRAMRSVAPIQELGPITLSYCCSDSPINLAAHIETWLASDGVLKKATYQVADGLITLDLAHPGFCQSAHLPPFNPDGTPGVCPPQDKYLRWEKKSIYAPGATDSIPCGYQNDYYYADGNCGEYKITEVIQNGGC